eukprot:7025116-Lingulodinium_polyedra.AAC.1
MPRARAKRQSCRVAISKVFEQCLLAHTQRPCQTAERNGVLRTPRTIIPALGRGRAGDAKNGKTAQE